MGQKAEIAKTNELESEWEKLDAITRQLGIIIRSDGSSGRYARLEPQLRDRGSNETKPDTALASLARKIYLARRRREDVVGPKAIFGDPAWSILLDLFIAHSEDKYISVTDVGHAGNVALSTALRWLATLENEDLVERRPDVNDKRRCFVMLSDAGLAFMRTTLLDMGDRFKPPLFSP